MKTNNNGNNANNSNETRNAAAMVASNNNEKSRHLAALADRYGIDRPAAFYRAARRYECQLERLAEMEAGELDNETDPARVPDWTRHAYEVAEMKRTGCTFGEARAKVAETRARILARREENNDKARRELRARAGSLVCKRDGYDRAYWQAIKDGDNAKADECARLEKEAADELAEVKKQLAELPAPLESAQDITDPDTADAVAAVVAKIENSPRPVVLFDNFAQTFEVSTKADPDGLHKWQALTAAGVESQGRATLQEVARMIAGE